MTSLTFSWSPPPGWHALTQGLDPDEWARGLVAAQVRPPALAARLQADLTRFVERVERSTARWPIVAVPPDPQVASRVVAAGWFEVLPPADVEQVADAVRAATLPPHVLSRGVEVELARRRSWVVCRDLVSGTTSESSSVLHERAQALVTYHRDEVAVRLEISTSDLSAFVDIGATCLDAASAFSFTREESS